MWKKLANFFKRLRKAKKPLYTYKWFPDEIPKIEGDTIKQCPHVASGKRKTYASIIIGVSTVKDVCKECYDELENFHKQNPQTRWHIFGCQGGNA